MNPAAIVITALCAIALAAASRVSLSAEPAGLIFTNGRIVTVDQESTVTQTMALGGERILYIGGEAGSGATLTCAVDEIRRIRVSETWLSGRQVYPRPNSDR